MVLELSNLDEQLSEIYDDIMRIAFSEEEGQRSEEHSHSYDEESAGQIQLTSKAESWRFLRIMWAVVIGHIPQKVKF